MKQYIKSYNIFFSGRILQIFTYLIYPILLIGIAFLLNLFNYIALIGLFIIGTIIISIEVFVDYNVFSGFAKRDTNRLEYMKTSVKCIMLVKKGIIADAVKRYIYITIIVVLSSFIINVDIKNTICILVVTYCISTVTIFIERFFSNFAFNYFLVYIALIIYSILIFGLLNTMQFQTIIVLSIIMTILSFIFTCFSIWFLVKRMEEAYYDE